MFILSDAPFRTFVSQVKSDAEADLAKYKIEDPATLQSYYTLFQHIAVCERNWKEALAQVDNIRDLESKESKRLMTGQVRGAIVVATTAANGDRAILESSFKKELARCIEALPWDQVREEVLQARSRAAASFV